MLNQIEDKHVWKKKKKKTAAAAEGEKVVCCCVTSGIKNAVSMEVHFKRVCTLGHDITFELNLLLLL